MSKPRVSSLSGPRLTALISLKQLVSWIRAAMRVARINRPIPGSRAIVCVGPPLFARKTTTTSAPKELASEPLQRCSNFRVSGWKAKAQESVSFSTILFTDISFSRQNCIDINQANI
jgi:hypothetical protein